MQSKSAFDIFHLICVWTRTAYTTDTHSYQISYNTSIKNMHFNLQWVTLPITDEKSGEGSQSHPEWLPTAPLDGSIWDSTVSFFSVQEPEAA